MSQPGDEALTCPQLQQKIADNDAEETRFLAKDKEVERGNVAKGVGSAVPYVGILIGAQTDLSNAEQVQARALADRNEWLKLLAKRKGCSE
jgi:hypothetical protein